MTGLIYNDTICDESNTLCCKSIRSSAFLWCKMPMFRRAGMREEGREATPTKGQLFSKSRLASCRFSRKRMDEFDLFAVKSKKSNKTNLSVRFWGESMARQSAFKINWPLNIENWIWKYKFGTFWGTIIQRRIVLKKKNTLSMLILGQKSWILGSALLKIPLPNWH